MITWHHCKLALASFTAKGLGWWKQVSMPGSRTQVLSLLIAAFFASYLLLIVRYQVELLGFQEAEDESETIVAAKMIAHGDTLYSDIFNQHGPLTFLPGVILESFGDFAIKDHRIFIMLLQLLALAALFYSPVLKNLTSRYLYTALAGTIMVVYLKQIYAHTYLYQNIAGLLLMIILAQDTLPLIMQRARSGVGKVIVMNVLISCLPFLAITYLPLAVILFLVSYRRGLGRVSIGASLLGSCLNLVFLAMIGSWSGYFVYHLYFNTVIFPSYMNLEFSGMLLNAFSAVSSDIFHGFLLLLLAVVVAKLLVGERGWPWRTFLLGLGIVSTSVREPDFQLLPFYYSCLTLPLALIPDRHWVNRRNIFVVVVVLIVFLVKVSLLLPSDRENLAKLQIPEATEFSRLVAAVTNKDDRIIAYTFDSFQYLVARRLPASGFFYYLPMQAKYNEHPLWGMKIDVCHEINHYQPKVMYIDRWNFSKEFPWQSYAGCIEDLLAKNYRQLGSRPYYLRRDIDLTPTE